MPARSAFQSDLLPLAILIGRSVWRHATDTAAHLIHLRLKNLNLIFQLSVFDTLVQVFLVSLPQLLVDLVVALDEFTHL